MSIAQQAARSAIFNTMANYSTQALGFLPSVILLRLLDPSHYGTFGFALVLASIFSRVKVWGFNQILLAETDPDDRQISTHFWLSTGFSGLVVLLVFVFQPALRLFYPAEQTMMALIIAAVGVLEADGITSTPETLLRRELRYGIISLALMLSTLLGLLVSIFLAALGDKTWALLGGHIARTVLYCAMLWTYAPRRPRLLFSRDYAGYLLMHGKRLLWGGLGSFLAFQYDDFAVGTFAGTTALGFYRKAYDWSLLPTSFINGVVGVSGSVYARLKDSREELSAAANSMLSISAMVTIPAAVGLTLVAREFIVVVFTDRWLPAAPILQLLIVYSILRPLKESFSGLATALKRTEVLRNIGVAQAVLMLGGCTVLTYWLGAPGAALSAGLTASVALAIMYGSVLRENLDMDYRDALGPPVLAAVIGVTIALLAARFAQPLPALGAGLLKGGIFVGIYIAVIGLTAQEKLGALYRLVDGLFRPIPAS